MWVVLLFYVVCLSVSNMALPMSNFEFCGPKQLLCSRSFLFDGLFNFVHNCEAYLVIIEPNLD